VLRKPRLQESRVARSRRQRGKTRLRRGGTLGKNLQESRGSPERSVRKGRSPGGNQRPDPDLMDLHHAGTQPANILPSRGVETENISEPGSFFAGGSVCFLGRSAGRWRWNWALGPRAAPCGVWAGGGAGTQRETRVREFIYLLQGERFRGRRFCNAGLN